MTEDKKHDDKDRKKVSDEELEDVAGGALTSSSGGGFSGLKGKGKKKPSTGIVGNPYPSPDARPK